MESVTVQIVRLFQRRSILAFERCQIVFRVISNAARLHTSLAPPGGKSDMDNFYTDVIRRDHRFDSVDRTADPNLLEPRTRELVDGIVRDAEAHGMKLMVFETYRSAERQMLLYDRGATHLRNVGVHHYGLACDLVKDINGHPSWKGDFSLLGHLARQYGLIWGGDWGRPGMSHSFVDEYHVQRCTVARQGVLFAGSWYPDNDYSPYEDRIMTA
jgi:D-alanyl-D-alanine carboxypeptidase